MVRKVSIRQFVYGKLKDAILNRKLAPGVQLVENTISQQLNVSRTPIRTAIKQLSDEGLVEIIPNKGAFVINPSNAEIEQTYDLRKDLEILALEKSINFFTKTDLNAMKNIVAKEKKAIFKKDLKNYLNYNKKFHMKLTGKCENKLLVKIIEDLINRTSIYLMLFDSFFGDESLEPYGYKEHLKIIELVDQRDIENLRDYLKDHFNNAIKSLDTEKGYKNLNNIFS